MTESLTLLRERMADELDLVPPMPDVADTVRRQGLVRRRRRRAATGLALGVTAVGAAYVVPPLGIGGPAASTQDRFAADGASTSAVAPRGIEVSEAEWRAAILDTFATLLPERFGPVVDNGSDRAQRFDVGGADPFWFHFSVRGRAAFDTSRHDCSAVVATGEPCIDDVFGSGWQLVAAHSRSDDTSEMAEITLSHDKLSATAYFFTEDLRPVPLTDAELADIGRSPQFRNLIRLGVEYAATRPVEDRWILSHEDGEQSSGNIPRPTWPGE